MNKNYVPFVTSTEAAYEIAQTASADEAEASWGKCKLRASLSNGYGLIVKHNVLYVI